MYQIGTEGGFLPGVAKHDNTTPMPLDLVGDPTGNTANPDGPFNLLLAPGERADLLIDFSGLAGKSFILYSDAPAPFPGGDPRNDYFTGDPDQTAIGGAPSTLQGHGPNTRTIMKIVVDHGHAGIAITQSFLNRLNTALSNNFSVGNGSVPPQQDTPLNPAGFTSFIKTLNEDFDDFGRLLQRGGTDQTFFNNQGLATYGQGYLDSITEKPSAGETQVWDIYNTTGDTHPWHFHLVNVQIIGRAPYATVGGGPIGSFNPPDANELGWKETVRTNPGEVTRVIMKFDLPVLPTSMGNPLSPRTGGHEYVHHCHILEHEEHDMMRALVVMP
jgi:spore coat protein A